jgi:hypothetical protein
MMLVGHHFAASLLDLVTQCVVDLGLLREHVTICQRAVELDARAYQQCYSQKHSSIAWNCGHSSGVAVHVPPTRTVVVQSDYQPMCHRRWLQGAARALECCRHQVVAGMPRSFRHEEDVGGAVAMTRRQRRWCGAHRVNHPNLLDGAKWWFAHEIHAWATLQLLDVPSLGAMMVLLGCLPPTNVVGYGSDASIQMVVVRVRKVAQCFV